ncbi:hypothetical protein UlMin_003582 [Ulmus minor]
MRLSSSPNSKVLPWRYYPTKTVINELYSSYWFRKMDCVIKSRNGHHGDVAYKQNFLLLQPLWSLSKIFSAHCGLFLVSYRYISKLTYTAGALTEENLLFLEIWRKIDLAYVGKTFNGQSWQSGTQGAVTGVGLSIGYPMKLDASPAGLIFISTSPGGPTNRGGISSGDLIMAINEASTETMGIYDALPNVDLCVILVHYNLSKKKNCSLITIYSNTLWATRKSKASLSRSALMARIITKITTDGAQRKALFPRTGQRLAYWFNSCVAC